MLGIVLLLMCQLQYISAYYEPSNNTETSQEYKLKAAFIYNFMKFVEWPQTSSKQKEQKQEKKPEPIIIGIIGDNPFNGLLEPLKERQINNRPIQISSFPEMDGYKIPIADRDEFIDRYIKKHKAEIIKCHALFICTSEKENVLQILNIVENHSILTISEIEGFIDTGGVIGFLKEKDKVGFEINAEAAHKARLKISSKLLRLAKRVKDPKSDQPNEPKTINPTAINDTKS